METRIDEVREEQAAILRDLDALIASDPRSGRVRRELGAMRSRLECYLARQDDRLPRRLRCHGGMDEIRRQRQMVPRLLDACEQAPPWEALMACLRLSVSIRRILAGEAALLGLSNPVVPPGPRRHGGEAGRVAMM